MHLVFFTHPNFLQHQSMPRYAHWLAAGMQQRGHTVELWTATPFLYNWPVPRSFKKWMSYLDQFLLFPRQIKKRLAQYDSNTLFVFTDHALGPWIPLVASRKHIIHCHDFLAQRSALNQIPQHPTSWSGKQYQAYIRNGYSKGKNFISISYKTREDLHAFLPQPPQLSVVIYNGVNTIFRELDKPAALYHLQTKTGIDLQTGFLLHVGGNQWYKNRAGVLLIYNEWRKMYPHTLPLLMIGENPDELLLTYKNNTEYKEAIHFLPGLSDADVANAYNLATLFLFPSLAEGFGWPIAESMACGCPVLTTGEVPMSEVGDGAAFYIPKMPMEKTTLPGWLAEAATAVEKIVCMDAATKKEVHLKGVQNVKRFESAQQLDLIESVYRQI